jgi:DNA helicase HerA-like ATPase
VEALSGPVPADGPAEMASALPALMISFLERRYLSGRLPAQWDLEVPDDDGIRPLLREITAVPRPDPADGAGPMPYVLSASHTLGQAVVCCVYGDGRGHRFFMGGRRLPGGQAGSTQDFLDGQAAVLRAQLPGVEYGSVSRLDGTGLPELTGFLSTAPALAAVTGIPAPRDGTAAARAFQGIDRLATAAGTQRYALLIAAEPLPARDLDATLDRLRELKSEIHALVRRTVSRSEAETATRSESRGGPGGPGVSPLPAVLTGVAAFCSVAGLVIPGAGVLAPLASPALYTGSMLRMQSMPHTETTATTTGQTRTASGSWEQLDAAAEACERLLDEHIRRLEAARSGGWWRTSVYVAAESASALAAVTSALRAIGSGAATALDPIRVLNAPPWLLRPALLRGQPVELRPTGSLAGRPGGAPVRHPLGRPFESLATCVTTDELAVLTALPRREVPGLRVTDAAQFALSAPPAGEDAVPLGHLLDSTGLPLGEVSLTGQALNRHVFITGATGYGKTTTATRLLTGAWTGLGVPFLVIEPVKREYRRLRDSAGLPLPGGLRVYGIGDPAALPLRLNPFAPIADVSLMRHIDLLKAVFNASFPMFAGMSYVLEEAMLEIYTDRGWDLRTSVNRALGRRPSVSDRAALTPTLADLHDKIEVVLNRRRYGPEIHQNMGAALRSRLRSLMIGAKGEALNCTRGVPPEQLFNGPCVIELRNLGDDDDRSFVMALLLCMLYEYAEARQADSAGRLLHLTLIEEAHRLLRAPRAPGGLESADAQAKAVVMFTDLLAEMRAYGEGFIVADQIPANLAPDIIKNSNVKIVHRLTAPDDRAAVAAATGLTDAQSRHLVTLAPGRAVVHDSDIAAAVLVQVSRPVVGEAAAAGPELGGSPPGDDSYLRRNGGCDRCRRPCAFLGAVADLRDEKSLDAALRGLFELLPGEDDDAAWQAWSQWRAGWDGDAGSAYCAVTQAAHRWLGRLARARAEAAGLGAEGSGPGAEAAGPGVLPPADLLGQERAARAIGRLVSTWLDARQLDAAARQALTTARAGLRAELASRPPRELPGCGGCQARCQYLRVIAPRLPAVGAAAGHRASAATPVATRVRGLRDLLRQHPDLTAGLDGKQERDLLYCLVTVASARSGTDASELLRAIQDTTADSG